MVTDEYILQRFNAGVTVDWLAKEVQAAAKADYNMGKGQKLTRKESHAVVEAAICKDILAKRRMLNDGNLW